jgi:hypothetical protein
VVHGVVVVVEPHPATRQPESDRYPQEYLVRQDLTPAADDVRYLALVAYLQPLALGVALTWAVTSRTPGVGVVDVTSVPMLFDVWCVRSLSEWNLIARVGLGAGHRCGLSALSQRLCELSSKPLVLLGELPDAFLGRFESSPERVGGGSLSGWYR